MSHTIRVTLGEYRWCAHHARDWEGVVVFERQHLGAARELDVSVPAELVVACAKAMAVAGVLRDPLSEDIRAGLQAIKSATEGNTNHGAFVAHAEAEELLARLGGG